MLITGKKKLYAFCLLLMVSLPFSFLSAQETTVYTTPYADFNLAMELFDKEKYSAAQQYFDKVIARFSDDRSEVAINARYYSALCAIHLFNNNAENLLIDFIRDYPENPRTRVAYFQLGNYWFRKRRYDRAVEWFDKVSVYDLDNDDIAEYYFKKGYAYFMEEDHEQALKSFYEIRDVDTRFTPTARYYYAHLSYLDEKYETALIDFRKIEHHPKFAGIVPYYIAQIFYLQGKYDSLLIYAPPLLDSAGTKRAPEISRLIGEAFYNTGQYEAAIPYLEKYLETNVATDREAYEIGYAHFRSGNHQQAIDWFEKSISGKDSLAQLSYYHMGESYLALGNKNLARNSLGRAAEMEFDREISEDALFSFAKLAYELSYHPYNDAIRAFEKYINTYPSSPRISKAHEYLLGVYYTTKNYAEALKSLDRIEKKNYKLERAYQRVAYYRGIELFNDRRYEDAIEHFELSLSKNYDQDIALSCHYWEAESWYRIFKQDNALASYRAYFSSPAAINHEYYSDAYYGEGYAHYRSKNYNAAIGAFRNFVRVDRSGDARKKNDALLRIGDCYFLNTQYIEAIEYYDKAILLGKFDTDYALFQSGMANGLIGHEEEKANLLLTLVEGYKESPYRDDALYELGDTYIASERQKALTYFDKLVREYPGSSYISKAYVKKGLIHYNEGNDEQALSMFKKVISDHRETAESEQAVDMVKRIYTGKGDLAGFQAFLEATPEIKITQSSLDSARYEIAENNYMSGNCKEAVKNFTAYIEKDTAGNFVPNARFYRAECEYQANYLNEALFDYEYILQLPRNKFTETALLRSAAINYQLNKLEKAKANYERLEEIAELPANIEEARLWLFRINFKLELCEEALKYGRLLLQDEKLNEAVAEEVRLDMAACYQKTDDYNKAFDLYSELAEKATEAGAEAKYNVASIEFLRGNYESSEAWVMRIVNQVPAFDYWIAKGFILLSDKYLAEKDFFQAKYTLESILENYEGKDLKEIARDKLEIIRKIEEKQKAEKAVEEEEVIIEEGNEGEENYEHLFEEEIIEEEEAIEEPEGNE